MALARALVLRRLHRECWDNSPGCFGRFGIAHPYWQPDNASFVVPDEETCPSRPSVLRYRPADRDIGRHLGMLLFAPLHFQQSCNPEPITFRTKMRSCPL